MADTILDPLALWGIQGMSQEEARELIALTPQIRDILFEMAESPDVDITDRDLLARVMNLVERAGF